MESSTPIPEHTDVTPARFWEDILPQQKPAVLKGLVSNWPIVGAARRSDAALADYLKGFDRGQPLKTVSGPPSSRGRLFYNQDLSGLNFQVRDGRLSPVLDYLLEHADDEVAPTMAIQSIPVTANLPGFAAANRLEVLGDAVEPRIWIGNKVTVAAHFDPSENIACCVAGRRRFTLFPPAQVENLYVGPFELTPAGATISMVSFEEPELDRYPRFREALAASQTAELEPGDAIFIPYLWWHHVRSLSSINVLVNYWWGGGPQSERSAPRDAMFHAMLTIRHLPQAQRDAWRAMFDHYIFQGEGAGDHLPPDRRGILGPLAKEIARDLRTMLAKGLSRRD